MNILFIGNNMKTSDLIRGGLRNYNIEIHCHTFQDTALETIQTSQSDVIILDIDNSNPEQLEIISQLRQNEIRTPLLVLSPHRAVTNVVPYLNTNESDFLLKPITVVELQARLQNLLNRAGGSYEPEVIEQAGVILDLTSRRAYRQEKQIPLLKNEFALLEYLMRHPGEVLTKTQILQRVWNTETVPETNIVDVLVFRLRKKIDKHFSDKVIRTVRGVGYVFQAAREQVA